MFLRIPAFIFALALSVNCLAQSPTAGVAKQTTAVPVAHRTASVTTPPINNIAASPKEVNKKKRKPVRVTVADKPKPVSPTVK